MAEDSILKTTKAPLGLVEGDDSFDPEIIMHINSVLGDLAQLGIGPVDGFEIADDAATWTEFLGTDKRFNVVKSYMFLAVKMLYDPPDVGYVLTAMEKQIEKAEWRINRLREDIMFPAPDPSLELRDEWGDPIVLDGGDIDAP